MSQPYIGEIRMFGGNFAPAGWVFCQGQLMPISENDTLFALIGTTFGGDGQETFGIPDLQGRVPVHQGTSPAAGGGGIGYQLGQKEGVESVTLTNQQMPVHTHPLLVSSDAGTRSDGANGVLASSPNVKMFVQDAVTQNLHAQKLAATGGSQPHDNMQPTVTVSYIMSLFGVFPSQT